MRIHCHERLYFEISQIPTKHTVEDFSPRGVATQRGEEFFPDGNWKKIDFLVRRNEIEKASKVTHKNESATSVFPLS